MTIRGSQSALLVCTAMVLLATNSIIYAQETSTSSGGTVLERIVVKGKRAKAAGPASDTPLASQTTAEDIRKKEINGISDLGKSEPGVDYSASKPGRPGGLFIRGLGGARVATLVDGIPVPYFATLVRAGSFSPTTGLSDSTNSFDFSSLSSVDVVKGADSSRIGSGAMGGALVLRTLEPEDLIEAGRDWGGVAKLTYDGEDRSFGGSLAVARRIDNTSVLFQGAYKKGHERDNQGSADVYGFNRTKANPADYDQNNLMFKIRQDLEGGHRIGMTAERFDLNTDTDLKSMQSASVVAGAVTFLPGAGFGYDDVLRERISFDYSYEAQSSDGLIDAATFTPFWQRLTKDAGSYGTRSNNTAYERHNTVQESSFGLTGSALSQFEAAGLNHEVRFGGTWQILQSEQSIRSVSGATITTASDMPDVDGQRLGLYLDDKIRADKSAFALTPGVRFDWYDYDPQSTGSFSGTLPSGQDGARFSPKLLATYDLSPELQLFAQWSMSYRAPTVDELYTRFNGGFYTVAGNPDLKPEIGNGFEVGANYEDAALSGKLTLFHNRYKNFIDAYDASGGGTLYTWRNRAKVEISGVELKGRQDYANGFFLHGSLAYAYGKDESTGEFLRSVAPFKAIVGVGYDQDQWGLDFSTIVSARMRQDGPASTLTSALTGTYSTFDAPGYGIFNLTGWWEPEQVKGLRIQAGVYNIFDKSYYNAVALRDLSTGTPSSSNQPVAFYSEPGRTFKISLTQKF